MSNDTKYLTLTEDNFKKEILEASKPALVDFWAGWCAPCRTMAPAVEELAADFQGTAIVGKLDVDAHGPLAATFGVQSIPTLLFFKDGKVVHRTVGVVTKKELADKLNAILAV